MTEIRRQKSESRWEMTGICLLFSVFCLLLLAGCGKESAPPPNVPTLTDATGTAVPITPPPNRLISFAPYITRNIYLLGAQDKLIGVTTYCKLPPGETKQCIGNLSNQDIEQVIKLSPDLILATKEGNDPEIITQARKMGRQVFVLSEVTSWTDIKKQFLQLGTILGKTKEAEQVIADCESRIANLSIRNPKFEIHNRPKVFVQLSEQLHTVGKDTFIDEAITYAGGVNIARETLNRWAMLSIEKVIREDPDLIIITEMGGLTETLKANWQRFPELRAVKNNKISIIESDILCQPTPENFVRLVEIISKTLNNE